MSKVRLKRGFFYSRIILPLWFLFMAVWTVFAPKQGFRVLEAYVKSNLDEKIKRDTWD